MTRVPRGRFYDEAFVDGNHGMIPQVAPTYDM